MHVKAQKRKASATLNNPFNPRRVVENTPDCEDGGIEGSQCSPKDTRRALTTPAREVVERNRNKPENVLPEAGGEATITTALRNYHHFRQFLREGHPYLHFDPEAFTSTPEQRLREFELVHAHGISDRTSPPTSHVLPSSPAPLEPNLSPRPLDDETLGEEVQEETEPVTLAILNGKEEHGRIYPNYGTHEYALPIDEKQRYQMEMNTPIIYRVLGKKHLCAPIGDPARGKTPRSILDICTGRGDLAISG